MLFVTGLGTLIAFYASEYMEADVGVGVRPLRRREHLPLRDEPPWSWATTWSCSTWAGRASVSPTYLLIGYYYQKPSAVAAAKKAFIMNRIGDLGLAIGIYLIWHNFGTVEYDALFAGLQIEAGGTTTRPAAGIQAIPFLLMLGAFGKSAQLPRYVWFPTRWRARPRCRRLIHAATMVTAGVYLIARMMPDVPAQQPMRAADGRRGSAA